MSIEKMAFGTEARDERLEQLKDLYPEIFSDGNINVDALKEVCGVEPLGANENNYGLYWPGKSEAKKMAGKKAEGTLEPVLGDGKNEKETNNIYIEGDNLEVLRVLKNSYKDRVKMIYIDPPYNTGKDFIYPDNYEESVEDYLRFTGQMDDKGKTLVANPRSNGRYHRNWLNMMYPRLKLAWELLKDDGVIFISIDDHEVSNLKLLCDEIFGEENLVILQVVNRTSEIASSYTVSKHEYCLCYSKSIGQIGLGDTSKYTISRGTVGNENQTQPVIKFPKGLKCLNIADGIYQKTRQITGSRENIENLTQIEVKNGRLANDIQLRARWRSSNDMRNFFSNNCQPTKAKINGIIEEIYFDGDRFMPYIKKSTNEKISSMFLENKRGSEDLNKLQMNNVFPFPKNVGFIQSLIALTTSENDIILDFFSGSATTAHALIRQNIDGLNRKMIMIQLPVNCDKEDEGKNAVEFLTSINKPHNICEIGKERIRRAGTKLLEEHPEAKGTLDTGFKVYRLAKSNFKKFNNVKGTAEDALPNLFRELEASPLEDGWQTCKESVLTEILLQQGFALDAKISISKTFTQNEVYEVVDSRRSDDDETHRMFVCLDEKLSTQTPKELHLNDGEKFICLDSAISDQFKAQLADKGRIETI